MATNTLKFDPSTAKPMNAVERKAFAKFSLALAEEMSANSEPLTRYERKHIGCFSYPECEDFPTGCHHYSAEMGIEVEEFGHKDPEGGYGETPSGPWNDEYFEKHNMYINKETK